MKPTVICISLIAASPAFTEDLPADVRACRFINTDAVRLACFDKATDPAAQDADPADDSEEQPAVDAEASTAPVSKWSSRQEKSVMTDQTSHFLTVRSTDYVQCSQFGNSAPLTLWARCMEDTTALIISGDCHLASGFDGYGEVMMRTDDDKAVTRSFEASTDNSALGLWTGGRAIPVLESMFGKERLVVRLTPFSMSPIEATFDIAGLEEAIKPLREECGW